MNLFYIYIPKGHQIDEAGKKDKSNAQNNAFHLKIFSMQ